MRVPALLSVLICAATAAQERPEKACSFDGFSADGKLAEVTRPTTGYWGCGFPNSCIPTKLIAGDVVTPYHTDSVWTCVYIQQRDSAGPGWVKASDIREIHPDPAPLLDAWAGTWTQGRGRIRITTASGGKLHLKGENEWHGVRDVVHTGQFEGDTSPAGNHLHFVEADAESCTIDLTLIGKNLVANDNQRCGGMNVRFWGIWKRMTK
jgi:hypothetical protein